MNTMLTAPQWEATEYQRIASVTLDGDRLIVLFEDNSRATVETGRLLPPGVEAARWADLTFNPYEILVATNGDVVEIPWSTIRVLTDRDYSVYLADAAEEQARQIGLRIKELREARNLSGRDLAERAGITPQSLSRIEHGRHDVVYTTLQRLLSAMGHDLRALTVPPQRQTTISALMKRVTGVGIDRDFLLSRLLPSSAREQIAKRADLPDEAPLVEQVARAISRVFGWSLHTILGNEPLKFDPALLPATKFKVRGRVNETRATAYTVYAHYLALLVLEATPDRVQRELPSEPAAIRQAIQAEYGTLNFANTLRFVWDCGVPVLPLRDPGAFHGACWRVDGRAVIVLKQGTDYLAHWLNDLLHEYKHVASHLDGGRAAIVETTLISPFTSQYKDSAEEHEASAFASAVVLADRAEELAQLSVQAANGAVEQLKSAAQQVGTRERVPVDALANYLAFRLASQKINWWGAASNLQVKAPSPWHTAREIFLDRIDIARLNAQDRDLLLRALDGFEEN